MIESFVPMALKPGQVRIPPQNTDAETALLGSILLRPVNMIDVVDLLDEDAFYSDKHRIIYQAMLDLHRNHEPIDTLSVSSRLKEKKLLDAVGGTPYLSELTANVPSSTNANYYAQLVADKYALRQLIDAGSDLVEMGFDESKNIEEILDTAEKKIFAVTQSPKGHKFVNIKDILPDVWETMQKLHEHTGDLRGVTSGFKGLDDKLSGFQKSDLIILAARPSMGKTSLSLDIARKAALGGVSVGYFSLEMSSQQLVDRMLAAESNVDLWKMRTGRNLTDQDFERIRDGMSRMSKAPIYIDDQAGNNIMSMRATARRLKAQYDLDLIIVDYLQLMTTSRNHDNMVNQVTEISRALKGLARELNVPVIALSQLSRAVEARGGKPRLSDLRDSGAIEQDADVVMFIHRDRLDDGGGYAQQAEVLIEKHRNGATGLVPLFFEANRATFMDVETSNYDEYEETKVQVPDRDF